MTAKLVILIIASYMIGNISPSTILARSRGIDIKAAGSGNAGTITPGGDGGDAKRWTGEFDEDEENLPAENGSSYSQYRAWEE